MLQSIWAIFSSKPDSHRWVHGSGIADCVRRWISCIASSTNWMSSPPSSPLTAFRKRSLPHCPVPSAQLANPGPASASSTPPVRWPPFRHIHYFQLAPSLLPTTHRWIPALRLWLRCLPDDIQPATPTPIAHRSSQSPSPSPSLSPHFRHSIITRRPPTRRRDTPPCRA